MFAYWANEAKNPSFEANNFKLWVRSPKQIKILKEIDYEKVKIHSDNENIDNIDLLKQKIFDK